MKNMKEIEKMAENYGNDLERVKKAIKAIQSRKCNLGKQKFRADYEEKMTEILKEERMLVEVRQLLDPKEKTVPEYTQADVDKLDYDETMKAIKSIQSKKFHSRWKTAVEGDNDEYRNAERVEQMLLEHKKNVRPVDDSYIRKTDLVTIIETIKGSGQLSQERIIEMLEGLL